MLRQNLCHGNLDVETVGELCVAELSRLEKGVALLILFAKGESACPAFSCEVQQSDTARGPDSKHARNQGPFTSAAFFFDSQISLLPDSLRAALNPSTFLF